MKYIYFPSSCYSNFNQITLEVRYLIWILVSNYCHLEKSPEGVI